MVGGQFNSNMNKLCERLKSFHKWPDTANVKPKHLAEAGFYYTGIGVTVCCFSCDGRIAEWKLGEIPLEKHRRLYENFSHFYCLIVTYTLNIDNF